MKRAEAKQLEEKWHDQMYRGYYLRIRETIRGCLPPAYHDDADDLCQEVFMNAWRQRDEVPRNDPEPWLAANAMTLLQDFQERQGIKELHTVTVSEERIRRLPDPSPQVTVVEVVMDTFRGLKRLQDKDADILRKHLVGYSYAEIAEMHDLTNDAARQRGTRARKHLGDDYIDHPLSPHTGPGDD